MASASASTVPFGPETRPDSDCGSACAARALERMAAMRQNHPDSLTVPQQTQLQEKLALHPMESLAATRDPYPTRTYVSMSVKCSERGISNNTNQKRMTMRTSK